MPAPNVWYSIAVEALESVIFSPTGGKVGIPKNAGR